MRVANEQLQDEPASIGVQGGKMPDQRKVIMVMASVITRGIHARVGVGDGDADVTTQVGRADSNALHGVRCTGTTRGRTP
ncbi:hypothetical protein V7S43_008600 [Phytophthora oleae]|uniref:Uncharacterized protein n=1 Tax=Phytophthora oleae TaxID=2107226 RepID=A0ABD3FHE7_9STRA